MNLFILKIMQVTAIKHIRKEVKSGKCVLWINNPLYSPKVLEIIPHQLLCYDLCDDYYEKEKDKNSIIAIKIRENDDYFTKKADVVFVATNKLMEERLYKNPKIIRIPNGVDIDYYRLCYSKSEEPLDMKNLTKPRLIYVGNISTSIDIELLRMISRKHQEWSLVMVGPVHGKKLEEEMNNIHNIYLVGVKSYEESIAYVKFSDIAIIPYHKSRWAITADTLKIYNYIASGKPVVTPRIGSFNDFENVLKISNNREEFIRHIEESLSETKDERSNREESQNRIIENHTWINRAEKVNEIIYEQLKKMKNEYCLN